MNNSAISYLRFSSSKQKLGASYQRQIEASEKYCKENNLTLIEQFEDTGISGWNEDNLEETAALGKILSLVKIGKITKGTTLIVENLDRITRANINTAVHLITGILDKGIDIVTTMDGKRYQRNCNSTDLMVAIIYLVRGNDESEIKSIRVKQAWQKKRELINDGKFVKLTQHPNWLKIENRHYVEDQEAANLVRRIFDLYTSGIGGHLIAKQLNKENIVPFSRTGKRFTFSSIERLLKNPAVIGRCEVVSPPKEDYYPRIISDSVWYKTQSMRSENNHYKGTRNDSPKINILSGLIKCRKCMCSLVIYSCKGKNKKRYHYLTCFNAKYGEHKMDLFPYQTIENLFITGIQHNGFLNKFINESKSTFESDNTIELQGKLIEKQIQIERIADAILTTDSKELLKRIKLLELEKSKLVEEIEKETKKLLDNKYKSETYDLLLKNFSDKIDEKEHRLKLRSYLRKLIKHILVQRFEDLWADIEVIFNDNGKSLSIFIEKTSSGNFNYIIGKESPQLIAVNQSNQVPLVFTDQKTQDIN